MNPYLLSSSRPTSSHQLTIDPITGMPHVAGGQPGRQCEVHMNNYQPIFGMSGMGSGLNYAGSGRSSQQMFQQAKRSIPETFLHILFYCCRANGLLAKFPSRAKRIDVISRFIFPLIFAIFNLAYWLYYLLAKNNFTGSKLEG